jgi:uncharacterized glyoxalase superfamily protein PhnB
MFKVNSYYPVLCVNDVAETANFYKQHFNFEAAFENEWYVHLRMKDTPEVNLAIVDGNHESVPAEWRRTVQGVLINFELEEVDAFYAELKASGLEMLLDLRDEPWGQRHFIVNDPAGTMIDVIKVIEPDESYKEAYQ